jgi:hypothetical protein
LLTDTFDTGALYFWTLGAGWDLIDSEGGKALANKGGDEAVTFVHSTLTDLAVQLRVRFENGMFRLSLRQSAAGAYTALLSADGQVALYRGTAVLGAATVAPNQAGSWRTLRLSAIGGVLRVQVDGVEVLAVQDSAPLPQGTFTFAGVGATGGVVVDDVIVYGNIGMQPTAIPTLAVPTPNPNLNNVGGITTQSISTATYAVVDSETDLLNAINTANQTSEFRIYLKKYTYTLTSSVQINTKIWLYGLGSEITIIRSNQSNSPLFNVSSTGQLTIQDLTLANASFNGGIASYGGMISNFGTTRIYNTVLRNNTTSNGQGAGGGAIFNGGTLLVDNSVFLQNTSSGGGGAIQNGSGGSSGTATITCSLFDSNSGSYGGALLNGIGSMTVSNSVFKNNFLLSGNPVSSGSAAYNVSGLTFALNNNFWQTWTPPGTIPVPGADNPNSPGRDTINSNLSISNVLSADPENTPACQNRKRARTTSSTQKEELSDYGISLDPTISDSTWAQYISQQDAFVAGVRDTAIALGILSLQNTLGSPSITPDDSPRSAFKRMMTDPRGSFSGVEFRVAGPETYCTTNKSATPLEARITCGTAASLTKYTIVHEFGHVLVDRTNGNYRLPIETAVERDRNPIPDERDIVFGFWRDEFGRSDWTRGERGWGSQALVPSICDGTLNITPPPGTPFPFQQNPCNIVDAQYTATPGASVLFIVEREEASADMFLNWVYSTLGEGGFADTNWTRPACQSGCSDTTLPGAVRNDWMNALMPTLVATYSW